MIRNMHVFTNIIEDFLLKQVTKCQAVAMYFYPTAVWLAVKSFSAQGLQWNGSKEEY